MKRVMCVWLPNWPLVRHEPDEDAAALRGLAAWCQRFSPVVGIAEPESLLLDVSGCAPLFGGERRLSAQLCRGLTRRGFSVRTAIAETVGAAWALAHFGTERTAIVPPGEQAAALRPLPVQALRLPEKVNQTLGELSVHRIEQLQALPRASLSSRFGPAAARRLDQALGNAAELISPVRPPEPLEAGWDFEHPTCDRRVLAAALRRLIERIAERLIASRQGAQRLEIDLVETGKREIRISVGLLRPCQSVSHLMELVQTRLEQAPLSREIAAVRIEASAAPLLQRPQGRLFDAAENRNGGRELAKLVDRLSSRLGKKRVVRPALRAEAQPELVVCWEPLLGVNEPVETERVAGVDQREPPASAASGGCAPKTSLQPQPPRAIPRWPQEPFASFETWPASARPLRLHAEPFAVEVTSVVPGGPPIRFFWNGDACRVAQCWGPERIETGWWRGRHVRRDYYRVETESGRRFWLFRRIGRGDWFLHGEFE